jgi:hypothetical protein
MTSPSSIEVTSTNRGLELTIEVPKRWWQFWLPDTITVPLARGQVIVLYQAIHKHAARAMIQGI